MADPVPPKQTSSTLLEPPLLKKYTPDTSTKNWKSQQYMPGIATQVESEWMEKLYTKMAEIGTMRGLIQKGINAAQEDHVSSRKQLNDSFESMITVLQQRRDELLQQMATEVTQYRKDLNHKLSKMKAEGDQLKAIKKQYDEHLNDKDATDIEQREKENVELISNALRDNKTQTKWKPKHPIFSINQAETNAMLAHLGEYVFKTEVPSPTVSVLVRTSENALIEVLMDERIDGEVLKYEVDIYKGALEEKEWANVRDDEYLVTYCKVIQADNICFYTINDLDDNEWYNIRSRAILKEDNTDGHYSAWLTFRTRPLGSDDEDDMKDVVPYTYEDGQKIEAAWCRNMEDEALKKKQMSKVELFLRIFEKRDLGLDVYQQKRLFFCMQEVAEGSGSVISAGDFANFVLNVGQRFDSKEWKTICKTIRE
eukprot:144028_1